MSSPRLSAVVDAGDDESASKPSIRPERGRGGRSRPACRRWRSRRVPSPKSTSSTHSGRRVVIERAVAERLPSGAITASSTLGELEQRRRSACRPSASIPSSLVSRTLMRSHEGSRRRRCRGVSRVARHSRRRRVPARAAAARGARLACAAARPAARRSPRRSRLPPATSSIVPTRTRFMWRMNASASIQNSSSVARRPPTRRGSTSRSKRTWSVSVGVNAVKSCVPRSAAAQASQRVAVERCGHHSARPRSNAAARPPGEHAVAVGRGWGVVARVEAGRRRLAREHRDVARAAAR